MTNTYIAHYEPGPEWLEGKTLKDQPLNAHVDYLIRLHGDGKVSMGGPFGDGSGGIVVFVADDINEVNNLVSLDPAISEGILVASVKHLARIV